MSPSISRRAAWTAAAVVVAVAAAVVGTAEAAKSKVDPRTYDVHKKAFGKRFDAWAVEWWQWLLSIPYVASPVIDDTGAHVEVGQRGPVWFLCGTITDAGSTPVRRATIPSGKALFFPAYNAWNDNAGVVPPVSVAELKSLIAGFVADLDLSKLQVVLDDQPIQGVSRNRVAPAPYTFVLPTGSVFETIAPTVYTKGVYYPQVTDGYWVMLKPLPLGAHTLKLISQYGETDYELTVVDHDKP